jgi:NAD(P)-dependent dehydrogenase (short-subunit alcohol dehydrogenase family)
VRSQQAVDRALPAGDVVNAAVFLASDEAAYITGTNLIVDGRWSAVLTGGHA